VIRNRRSHRNRGAKPESPGHPDVLTVSPRDREELGEALAQFAEERIELLVVDGGDGTMREVLTRGAPVFGERWPKLVVLPKGKTNALALDLGMPSKWTLAEALRAAPHARVVKRRPILIDQPEGAGRQVMGFILGAGVFNEVIAAAQVAHRFGAFQGFAVAVTALFGVLQALFGIGKSPWRKVTGMRIRTGAEGRDVPHSRHGSAERRFASGISSLRRFPLGMRPFADTGADREGGIRYLVVDAPLRRVIALVPAVLMGLDRPFLPRLGVHRGAADELTLELEGSFILDGEGFPPGRYRLRPGPELHFLVP
jgi:diacylglycerol kinase family enzyme